MIAGRALWFLLIALTLTLWLSWVAVVARDERSPPGVHTLSIPNPWTARDCGDERCMAIAYRGFTAFEGTMGIRISTPSCSKTEVKVFSRWNPDFSLASWTLDGGVTELKEFDVVLPGDYVLLVTSYPVGDSCDRPRPGSVAVYRVSEGEYRLRALLLVSAVVLTLTSFLRLLVSWFWRRS